MKTVGAVSYSHIKLGDLRRYLSDEIAIPVQRKWLEKLFSLHGVAAKPDVNLDNPQQSDKVEPLQIEVVKY